MSARIYAEITIGGSLDEHQRLELIHAIRADQPTRTNAGKPVPFDATLDDSDLIACVIDCAIAEGTTLKFYDDSCDGEFAAIEQFCQTVPTLRYYRMAKPHDDYDGEINCFDGTDLYEAQCDGRGDIVVPLNVLERMTDEGVTGDLIRESARIRSMLPLPALTLTGKPFHCDGPCTRRDLAGPPAAKRVRFSRATGTRFDKAFCSSACVDAYDAEERKLEHYECCPSQDDLRDAPCERCSTLTNAASRLRRYAIECATPTAARTTEQNIVEALTDALQAAQSNDWNMALTYTHDAHNALREKVAETS